MDYTIPELLDLFNNGNLDVEFFFNDYETFFEILKRRNLMKDLNPIYGANSDDWQNEYLIWLYKNGEKEKFKYWVSKLLSDVVFGENNEVFLEISDKSELSRLFCDNRRGDLSRDAIETILKGEDTFEAYFYGDTTENIYDDVLKELTEKNVKIFLSRMVNELEGKELSPVTEEMESIAQEQGHEDYWILNEENVARIFDDKESMNSLLDDELSEFKSNLYSIHVNAYNSAYESKLYKKIFKELEEYFSGTGQWISKIHPYKKDTTIEIFKIPFHDFYSLILNYLENNKNYGNRGSLGYHGGILSLMGDEFECLSVDAPDYPDYSEIEKNINMFFEDYF